MLLVFQKLAHSRSSPKLSPPPPPQVVVPPPPPPICEAAVYPAGQLQASAWLLGQGPTPGGPALGGPAEAHHSFPLFCTSPGVRERAGRASSDTLLLHRTVCALLPPPESSELSKYGCFFSFPKHQEHLGEENEHQTWFGNDGSQVMGGGGGSTV